MTSSDQDAPGLQHFDYMEIDSMDLQSFSNPDPNLNVTSEPEQLDAIIDLTEASDQTIHGTSVAAYQEVSEDCFTMVDLANVGDADITLLQNPHQVECYSYAASDFYASGGCDVSLGIQMKQCSGPATVTLVKPQPQQQPQQLPQQHLILGTDPVTTQLMQELYKEEPDVSSGWGKQLQQQQQPRRSIELCHEYSGKGTKAPAMRQSQPPSDSAVQTPNLPMFEPQDIRPIITKPMVHTPAFDLVSPTESVDTGFTYASEDTASTGGSVLTDREVEIERMAAYVRDVIEKRSNKPDDMSSKLKVHEVILVVLLNSAHGNKSKELQRILAFCDENGRESTAECRHFKTLDTETMGLLWQKIKGNKKGNYDTFARAMRVRRERSEGFFEYLDAGKGKRKRIYRFGSRSMDEMGRLRRTLREVSKPQTCSF